MKHFTLLLFLFCATLFVNAEDKLAYTITFKDNSAAKDPAMDGSNAKTTVNDLISEGGDNVVSVSAAYIYNGKVGYGIKGGSAKKKGTLTLVLKESITPTKVVIEAANYPKDNNKLIFLTNEFVLTDDFKSYDRVYDGNTSISEITMAATIDTNARFYVKSVKVYTKDTSTAIQEVKINANVRAENGTIYANGNFSIYNISGSDVTKQNGSLKGIYIVKVAENVYKVAVK